MCSSSCVLVAFVQPAHLLHRIITSAPGQVKANKLSNTSQEYISLRRCYAGSRMASIRSYDGLLADVAAPELGSAGVSDGRGTQAYTADSRPLNSLKISSIQTFQASSSSVPGIELGEL